MKRAEREQDEDRREPPDDPQRGAELLSDVSESQQVTKKLLFNKKYVLMSCPHIHMSSMNQSEHRDL